MKIKDIKFKAKRLDNGEWIIGSFVVMKIPALSKTTIGIVEAGGATLHEIDPVTVCQFTGLQTRMEYLSMRGILLCTKITMRKEEVILIGIVKLLLSVLGKISYSTTLLKIWLLLVINTISRNSV